MIIYVIFQLIFLYSIIGVTLPSGITLTTEMNVISSKDFETLCKQPILIGTVMSMMVFVPLHMISLFAVFTKLDKLYNPNHIMANLRRNKFANRVVP